MNFMICSIFFSLNKPSRTDVSPAGFSRHAVCSLGPPETALPIFQSFNFHRLAMADALEQHAPKVT
jgi:hypothetical protein